ncbi:MAG: 30S ribosome-binding factor RbfA [Firmicutes bacterium]|nr:30S ribosome-binding factor RbfA [Bacillota bacterium]
MSIRLQRVGSEMQKNISEIIRTKLQDPRIDGFVSILSVEVAKDLKTAKVTVSISSENDDAVIDAIRSSAGFIKRELSQIMRDMRTTPDLNFILDKSLKYSERINQILEGIKADSEN